MIKSFLKTGVLLLLLVPCAVTHAQFFSDINHPELEWFEIETTGIAVIDAISQVQCGGVNDPTCRDPSGQSDPDTAKAVHTVTLVEAKLVDEQGGILSWFGL